ncbi:MAG: autotransporter-associated beta strand repeat-containing protein, partial [Candidatus Didemnitutus sp.]|nr:autotransporter-associated beta strand repeat-containing protein [Candidatus Didemnitutus sp.]
MHLVSKLPVRIAFISSALLLSANVASANATDHNLYWDPNDTNTTTAGGTGTWNTSSANAWYTGDGAVQHTWVNTTSIATYYNLYFGGAGQVAPYTVTTNLSSTLATAASTTFNLFFQGDYILTRDAASTNTAELGSTTSSIGVVVSSSAGKSLSVVAGTDTGETNRIVLKSGTNNSANPSLLFTGGGSISLGKNVDVQGTSANGHVRVGAASLATSLTATAGATITAPRLQLANGALNINGGAVSLGVTAGANSARGNSALFIGTVGTTAAGYTPSVVNLNSGTLTALPGTGANGGTYGQGKHGVVFAIDPTVLTADAATTATGLSGGTFNLNGGTLTTTDILANPYATTDVTAKFVFNGGTLVVSAAATQDHLNGFMTGFKDTAANHISIASGGATINTGSINTGTTNGIATIDSVIRGSGDLTKAGANTLRLSAANTYTGRTVISGGTLALGATGGLASSEISIADGANFDVSARTGGFRLVTGQNLEVAGTGLFTGTLGVGSDTTAETITLSNNLNLASGAGLLFDLGAT